MKSNIYWSIALTILLICCFVYNGVANSVANLSTQCLGQLLVVDKGYNKSLPLHTLNLTTSKVEANITELIWTPINNINVDTYLIYRVKSIKTNGLFYLMLQSISDATLVGSTHTTKFVDSNIVPGETYTYFVKYIDDKGETYSTTGAVVVSNPIA
ncbi:MAG: hypothetical protein LBK70_01115 [Clostridiales bacterium]|jgi:hypothetical protein|nr:hypothetical protein [Clostridiales bacterium]